jgi:prepilin-type N-terminal cleavage/methylation domain-containing protein
MSRSIKQHRKFGGFSMLEVLIALAVLVIGISAMASLSVTMMARGRSSKYMNVASALASEKIEDLSRWTGSFDPTGVDTSDPQICVPSGYTSVGSLDQDLAPAQISCGSSSESVSYNDNLSVDVTNASDCPNPADGCFAESIYNAGGYNTTYHAPDGTITQNNNAPTLTSFHRRWLIEVNPTINGVTVNGVRRITVKVYASDPGTAGLVTGTPPTAGTIFFQMSVVRP